MDFSDVPDSASFASDRDADGYNGQSDVLYTTALSPDGNILFYVNNDLAGRRRGISALQLPPSDSAPNPIRFTNVSISVADNVGYYFMDQTSLGVNGRTLRILMMGYLFTFEIE
jgi:hypothetical protein